MKLFNIFAAGAMAGLVATSALAASDSVINAITQDLAAQGYTKIRIVNAGNTVKVEAYGPNGSLEQVYDGQGNVIRTKSERGDGGNGLVQGVISGDDTGMGSDNGGSDRDHGFRGSDDNGRDDDDHGGSDNDHGGRGDDNGGSDNDHGGRGDDNGRGDNDHGDRDGHDDDNGGSDDDNGRDDD